MTTGLTSFQGRPSRRLVRRSGQPSFHFRRADPPQSLALLLVATRHRHQPISLRLGALSPLL